MKTLLGHKKAGGGHHLPSDLWHLISNRRPLTSDLRSLTSGKRGGFTIIELLAVITLIAMLIALLFGAAQYVIRTARDQQAHTTATALQVAIASYRHEYGQWPTALALPNGSPASGVIFTNSGDGYVLTVPGPQNNLIFDVLINSSTAGEHPQYNTNNVLFIDNSTVLTTTDNVQCIRRFMLLPPPATGLIPTGHPIVYVPRDGGIGYYSVTIWFDLEKCEVDL
jgi:prepilin-type N-terminal cleavage/methylation domain-containing protein